MAAVPANCGTRQLSLVCSPSLPRPRPPVNNRMHVFLASFAADKTSADWRGAVGPQAELSSDEHRAATAFFADLQESSTAPDAGVVLFVGLALASRIPQGAAGSLKASKAAALTAAVAVEAGAALPAAELGQAASAAVRYALGVLSSLPEGTPAFQARVVLTSTVALDVIGAGAWARDAGAAAAATFLQHDGPAVLAECLRAFATDPRVQAAACGLLSAVLARDLAAAMPACSVCAGPALASANVLAAQAASLEAGSGGAATPADTAAVSGNPENLRAAISAQMRLITVAGFSPELAAQDAWILASDPAGIARLLRLFLETPRLSPGGRTAREDVRCAATLIFARCSGDRDTAADTEATCRAFVRTGAPRLLVRALEALADVPGGDGSDFEVQSAQHSVVGALMTLCTLPPLATNPSAEAARQRRRGRGRSHAARDAVRAAAGAPWRVSRCHLQLSCCLSRCVRCREGENVDLARLESVGFENDVRA